MNGGPVSRSQVVSRAWLFSAALHGGLVATLSYCYVTRGPLHNRTPELPVVEVSLLREPSEIPIQPLAEMRDEPAPLPPLDVRPQEAPEETEPLVVTALEDEPTATIPAVEPIEEATLPESPSVRFDATPVVKKIRARQFAAGDGGGGAQAGSGGAPALTISASGTVAAGRGASGGGSGSGAGTGSGSGNVAGSGAAASGHGFGNGQGDGVGSGTGGRGGVVTRPAQVLRIAQASYPRDAQRAGYEGLVKVLISVAPSGAIDSVSVVQSSGFDSLDTAACAAARQSRFAPKEEDGKPIACSFTLPYRFTLRGR